MPESSFGPPHHNRFEILTRWGNEATLLGKSLGNFWKGAGASQNARQTQTDCLKGDQALRFIFGWHDEYIGSSIDFRNALLGDIAEQRYRVLEVLPSNTRSKPWFTASFSCQYQMDLVLMLQRNSGKRIDEDLQILIRVYSTKVQKNKGVGRDIQA